MLGIALLMTETLGSKHLPHTEERIGELMLTTDADPGLIRAAEADAKLDEWGVMCPDPVTIESTRNLFMTAYPRMIEILQLLGSSSFMITPSEVDFKGPLAADIEQYLATDTTRRPRSGEAVPSGVGRRGQLVRQPAGAVRTVLRLRPIDTRARFGCDLSQERGDGARAGFPATADDTP